MRKHPKTVSIEDQEVRAISDIPKLRACMLCKENFQSDGFGDRICRRCKSSNTWRNGIATTYGKSRNG